jgi:predicted ATPase/DNA-binding SARP family transcriptional activator/Tfp pilus assembly protein PilF
MAITRSGDTGGSRRGAPSLVVRLFGAFELRSGERQLLPFRKDGYVFALLVLHHPNEVQRPWLAEQLWPDSLRDAARVNLRNSLSHLRRVLGSQASRLRSPTSHTLQLDLTGADVDVLAFDAAIAQGNLAALAKAIRLYRGELLQGCDEPWVAQPREERHQAYQVALETLVTEARAQDDEEAAEHYLRQARAADPLRESTARALMELLAAAGRFNEAFSVYDELSRHLGREHNATPDPETEVLVRQIRADARRMAARVRSAPAPKGPSPRDLPKLLIDLIGRHREVRDIRDALRRSWLVTLLGPPGIGKTQLAVYVAHRDADTYTDGAWLVELGSLPRESDPGKHLNLVAQTIADRLGVLQKRGASILQTVEEFLRPKHLLLVLDNCEHLIHSSAQLVERLLTRCHHLRILATSRQPLRITGERRYRVGPLAVPEVQRGNIRDQEPKALLRYGAIKLFTDRAKATESSFALTTEHAPSVVRICQRLDGIPLAIELAAARVELLSPEQIAGELDHRFQLLTGGSRTALPRQQTLQATLDWSYDLLTEREEVLLRRLSVFRGRWSLEAARQICKGEVITPDNVRDLVQQLVDKSLVATVPGEYQRRFWLLETIREYAEEKLTSPEEEEAVRWRHFGWYMSAAEQAQAAVGEEAHGRWLDRLEAEHDNLRAALEWSATGENVARGLYLALILSNFWEIRGYWHEGQNRLVSLLALSPDAPQELRAAGSTEAGSLALLQGDYQAAGRLLAEGARIWQELNDHGRVGEVVNLQGNVALEAGNLEAAQAHFEQSLKIARALEDQPAIAHSLHNLAQVALATNDYQKAESLLTESLAIKRQFDDHRSIALTLNNLGYIYLWQNQYVEACPRLEESLALFRDLEDRLGMAMALGNLGIVFTEQGNLSGARRCHAEALEIDKSLGNKQGVATTLNDLGLIARREDNFAEARDLLEQSLIIWKELLASGEIALHSEMASTLYNLGKVAWYQGDFNAARSFCEQSLTLKRQLDHQPGIASSLHILGLTSLCEGRFDEAKSLIRESLLLHQRLEDDAGIAKCLEGMAIVNKEIDELARAARLLAAAEALRTATGTARPATHRTDDAMIPAALKAALGEAAYAVATAEGRAMAREQAIEEALRDSSAAETA